MFLTISTKGENNMEGRLDYSHTAPGASRAMYALQKYVEEIGLEHSLLELVETRASQINGCAYCIDQRLEPAGIFFPRSGGEPSTACAHQQVTKHRRL